MDIAKGSERIRDTTNDITIKLFWIGLFAHVVLWTLICTLTQPNLPLDMVEMTFWGEQWQLGYHKHPPLPAWIAATVWQLGNHSPWLMYLTSQLTIAVTFWAVWQLAREGLPAWLALCSVAVLQGCYYCTFMINDINNTNVTRPFWALSILFLYRAISSERPKRQYLYWCLTGVTIGLGMLCKYYLAILLLAMMSVPLLIPSVRKSLRTVGPWLTTAIALLIFSPHLVWMINNDFVTVQYALDRSTETAQLSWTRHILSPTQFLLSQIGAWLPIVLLSWPLIGKTIKTNEIKCLLAKKDETANATPIFRTYLSIVVLGPILIYVVVALITGANIRSKWGGPLFSFLGVWLIANYPFQKNSDANITKQTEIRKALRGCLVAATVMLFAFTVKNTVIPPLRGEFSRVHFPGQVVSQEVQQRWAEHETSELSIVGGDMFVAGCTSVYAEKKLDVYAGLKPITSPWVSDEEINKRGAMIVWNIDETGKAPPSSWLNRFPNSTVLEPFQCHAGGAAQGLNANVGMLLVSPDPQAPQAATKTRTAKSDKALH